MEIRTKKYSIPTGVYFKECYKNIIFTQWWVIFIFNSILGYSIYAKMKWLIITISVLEVLYFLFWVINLIGIQYLPQSELIFAKVFYIFSDECIKICVTENNMAIVNWEQVKKVKNRKTYSVLFLAAAHVIYVPTSAFRSKLEKDIFLNMLKSRVKKCGVK